MRRLAWARSIMLAIGVMGSAVMVDSSSAAPTPARIRFAVLGDSDSHAYHDRLSFPDESGARGGIYHASTLQWTEVLNRLRAAQVDMGPWGEWGQRRPFAQLRESVGMSARSPKKEDFLYNMAVSGAVCDDLMIGIFRQAPRLADLIREEPDAWKSGIVIIRMGINDIGTNPMLQLLAKDPDSPTVVERSAHCAKRISEAVQLLRGLQPALKFVLVGPFNDTDDPSNADAWHSALEQANLHEGFLHLNDVLRAMAARDPNIRFKDDNAWFRARWGGRDADGKPAYATVHIGNVLQVTNSIGNEPTHSVLTDSHAGLVWNTLWAQALVNELDAAWSLGIPPIDDGEVARFIEGCLKARPATR